jgi:hypothetical protein
VENRDETIYPGAEAEVAQLRSLQADLEARWLDPIAVAQHLAELLRAQAIGGSNGSTRH